MASNGRFVVDLGDLKLDDKTAQRIETAIQKTVLNELAGIEMHRDTFLRFPKDWLGFILRKELGQINEIEKQVQQFAR